MESVKNFIRRVIKRVRGNKRTITRKRHNKEPEEQFGCGDVQIVRYNQRCNGTIALTPDRRPLSEQQSRVVKRSSEELDERINTIRARYHRHSHNNGAPPDLDNYVYVGSMLHVSITRQVAGHRDHHLPPLNPHFAASNISTFIERLTFSHATAGHDHSTPLAAVGGRHLALMSRRDLPALSFLRGDDEYLPQIQPPLNSNGLQSPSSV